MVKKRSSARFGSKYGKRLREEVLKTESKYRGVSYNCPACSRKAVKRVSAGVWKCRKCSKKFASLSYSFNIR
ncbi:MAG: 50S ribosomal protein L37ae [Candidatus Aenigmatarchaeota archaeon]